MKRLEPKGIWKYRWDVPSSSSPDTRYVVAMSEHGDWACGCIGWTRHFPRKDCRHITGVKRVEPRVDAGGLELQYSAGGRRTLKKEAAQPSTRFAQLSQKEVAAIEKKLWPGGPAPTPEPYFVRQTRRAISLED